jgi:DNA-binding SARP family transcriptional activator
LNSPRTQPRTAASIELEVLGPLRAVRNGAEISVGAAKLRVLAAALVVNAPAGVPIGELVAALWGERPPSSAHKTLQTYVMQLRRLLGPSAVLTETGRYRLGVEVSTDAQQFETLIGEARALGDPQRRAAILVRALSMWRGDPYAELDDWLAVIGRVRRLHELRAQAQELRAEALIEVGMLGDCIAELERMVVEDPLRERRWELLMVALYHAGRQAEALRAYQRARSALIDQLGVEPGTTLRALEIAILQHDPSLNSSVPSEVASSDAARWDEALRAGDDARGRGELATAMAAYRGALATHDGARHSLARECEVLIRLAEVEYLAGDPAHRASATAAARLADQLNDTDLLCRAVLATARHIEAAATRTDLERVATLRRAADVATTTTKARILAVLASELTAAPNHIERRRLSDQALALARQCGDARALHQVLAARAATIRAPDTLAERLSNTAEDLSLTATDDDLRRRFGALSNRALTCLDAGMVTEAEHNDRLAGAVADEMVMPGAQWRARYVEARDLTRVGDLRSAELRAIEALRIGRSAGEDAAGIFAPQIYLIRWQQGRVHELAQHLDARPLASALDRAFACHASAQLGRREDSHRLLVGLAARGFADVAFDGFWLTVLALAADVAANLGDEAIMSELYGLLQPWKEQCAATQATFLGAMTHPLALLAAGLGSVVDADEAFRDASASHARHDAPILDARLQLEWGRFLADRDAPLARTHLTRAARAADQLGAGGIATEASQMLGTLASAT